MATPYGSFNAPDAPGLSNLTALQPILKEFYGPQQVKSVAYQKNKWLAMVHKEEDWSGLVVPIPIQIGNPQGRSATFSTAKANQTASTQRRFVMNWAQDYSIATITNLVNLASRNDAGAFLKAVQNEMGGAMRQAVNSLGSGMFRSYTGTIGSTTAIASGVVTLSDYASVTQFEVGQTIEAAATDGGVALGTVGYVVAVDSSVGTVTFSTSQGGAATTPASWSGTMFFRVQGDLNLKLYGLADWIPTTRPTNADNFNGVNRSIQPTRLAGVMWDGSTQNIEEAIVDAAALTAREEGNIELAMTNFTTFAALEKALGSKVNYVNYENSEVPGIGFQGLRISGPDSEINIFADRNCPGKLMYLIDPDSWTLGSMMACPHILTELDGLDQRADPNNDAIQIRIGSYAIQACDAPGHNAVVKTQL